MGDNTPQESNVINLNEETRQYANDPNNNWIAVSVDANGNLNVNTGGSGSITVAGEDGDPIAEEALNTAIAAGDIGLVTYLSSALSRVGQDQVRVDLQNDNLGTNLDTDIAEQSLAQLTTVLEADDQGGNTAEVQAQELGGTIGGGETALFTVLANAFESINNESLLTTTDSRDEVTDFDTGNDINASTASFQFDVTAGMDSVSVAVDDAAGSFHVEVAFQDGAGNDVVVRDNNNSSDFAGDSTTDVFVDVEIAAPQVEVRIVDDSGAANTVDYNIRAN